MNGSLFSSHTKIMLSWCSDLIVDCVHLLASAVVVLGTVDTVVVVGSAVVVVTPLELGGQVFRSVIC